MTPEEIEEIKSLIFATLADYEEMKKARRVRAVKQAIRGTIAATALSGVGCVNLPENKTSFAQKAKAASTVLASIQQQPAMSAKETVRPKNPEGTAMHKQAIKGVVHFGFDSAALGPLNQERLDALAEQLPKDVELVVLGHTDSYGDHDYNLKLGKKRAQMVAKYLAWRGLTVKSIGSRGEHRSRVGWEARRVDVIVNHNSSEKLAVKLPSLSKKAPTLAEESQKYYHPKKNNLENVGQENNGLTQPDLAIVKPAAAEGNSAPTGAAEPNAAKPISIVDAVNKLNSNKIPGSKQTVKGVVHFPMDSASLALAHRERLDAFIKQLPKNAELTVLGYTDSKGYGAYNRELGKERALMVARYLAVRGVSVLSYGSKRVQKNVSGWASRRVDIVVSYPGNDKLAIILPPIEHKSPKRHAHSARSLAQDEKLQAGRSSSTSQAAQTTDAANNGAIRPVANVKSNADHENVDLPYDIQYKMTDTALDSVR